MPASPNHSDDLLKLTTRTLRGLAMDGVQAANSGHPGMPMGMADVAAVLWSKFQRHNPADPQWPNRDRFVLSAGHGSMLIYGLLHLWGYEEFPLDELKQFRQLGSRTAGHPENFLAEAIETTTGPLGQGLSNAVGMALAEKFLAATFNRDGFPIVDHYTYVIASDGDLMEGITNEASSIAGHLKLGKLVVLYDDNDITIDGTTALAFSEDVLARYEALGWHTVGPIDGHDPAAIEEALKLARSVADRPTIISCKTTIGFGSPNKAGTASAHGEPLGPEEVIRAKEVLGIPQEPAFFVPDDVYEYTASTVETHQSAQAEWEKLLADYRSEHPELATKWDKLQSSRPPKGWEEHLPVFPADPKGTATRNASGSVLDAIFEHIPHLIGGSADLTPSNKTRAKEAQDFSDENPEGRYLRFGVREHAMGAICNGIALHGGLRPFGGTFLIFSDYMKAAIRLSALMKIPALWIYTHDSIGLGEDGPTHQPVEHLAGLRAIPNLYTIRPADANETVEAWRIALNRTNGPTALALTRQNLPTLDRTVYGSAEGTRKGAYVVADGSDVLLLATGSEVQIALDARDILKDEGISARVVSMPCWELFREQGREYIREVLPTEIEARVAVEAASPLGWHEWVGSEGAVIGMSRFGASGPYEQIYETLGLTPEAVADAARQQLAGRRGPIGTPRPEGAE